MSLSFRGIEKRFGAERVLSGVDLDVEDGRMLTVVGPSGGGKTTLLRLAAGLERPDAGRVTIDGRPARLGDSSVAFQDTPLYPHLTVAENVLFPLRLARSRTTGGQGRAAQRKRAEDALEMMRIGGLGSRRIHQLSGGQRQRVGIARALVRDVALYLFDEPLAHLDPALARLIRDDLRSVQRDTGLTMMYVTHHLDEAFALGDTVAVLNGGKLEQVGTPWDLWNRPAGRFVGEFLGGVPMNFVDGRQGETLGFRPEHCVVEPADSPDAPAPWSGRDGLRIAARVVTATFLGEETLLHLDVTEGGQRLRAMVPSSEWSSSRGGAVDSPARVEVSVPPQRIHRFDGATGRRIDG
ncbi:ABC transporter ATP-binding protein [Curtobacterium sp. S6]|uniref:ABC transporter ATP-binding protein n=1 Tax=Curtobacterium sp. S6 TaxID=1479623 RepID=UPI0004AA667D|nr:ABC transporter ATP-binding protein [Curtobacterium sp. S6]